MRLANVIAVAASGATAFRAPASNVDRYSFEPDAAWTSSPVMRPEPDAAWTSSPVMRPQTKKSKKNNNQHSLFGPGMMHGDMGMDVGMDSSFMGMGMAMMGGMIPPPMMFPEPYDASQGGFCSDGLPAMCPPPPKWLLKMLDNSGYQPTPGDYWHSDWSSSGPDYHYIDGTTSGPDNDWKETDYTTTEAPKTFVSMGNPASINCAKAGGKFELREDQIGFCMFEDGSECEEWALMKQACMPGQSLQTSELAGEAGTGCWEDKHCRKDQFCNRHDDPEIQGTCGSTDVAASWESQPEITQARQEVPPLRRLLSKKLKKARNGMGDSYDAMQGFGQPFFDMMQGMQESPHFAGFGMEGMGDMMFDYGFDYDESDYYDYDVEEMGEWRPGIADKMASGSEWQDMLQAALKIMPPHLSSQLAHELLLMHERGACLQGEMPTCPDGQPGDFDFQSDFFFDEDFFPFDYKEYSVFSDFMDYPDVFSDFRDYPDYDGNTWHDLGEEYYDYSDFGPIKPLKECLASHKKMINRLQNRADFSRREFDATMDCLDAHGKSAMADNLWELYEPIDPFEMEYFGGEYFPNGGMHSDYMYDQWFGMQEFKTRPNKGGKGGKSGKSGKPKGKKANKASKPGKAKNKQRGGKKQKQTKRKKNKVRNN